MLSLITAFYFILFSDIFGQALFDGISRIFVNLICEEYACN